jgi:heptosyltransferase-3
MLTLFPRKKFAMSYGNYPDLSEVKKILVVKMRHHGDVLLTSPVFSNLKKRLPNASITACIYKETLPMLDGHPAIDDFMLYERKSDFAFFREIRRRKYDMVINLTEGDRGAIAALVSGAKIRVGFDPEGKGFLGKRKSYTHIVKNCKTPRHTVERQLDALRCIGIFPAPEERDLTFHIPPEIGPMIEGDYIVIHPVSRWRFKCWPVAHVARLIGELQNDGHKVVLTASPDRHEMAMAEEIMSLVPNVINMAGKTSLKQLGALIHYSQCLICVDTVALHMASALKAPVVVLFGPTSEKNWGPWMHPSARVVTQDLPCRPCFMDGCGGSKMSDCLYTLPVQRVREAVEQIYSKNPTI